MNSVTNEFNETVKEVEKYFNFLDKLHNNYEFYNINTNRRTKIDNELLKILRANGFLILYNLVEATLRNSINLIFDNIKSDSHCYEDLIIQLKNIWLLSHQKSLNSIIDKKSFIEKLDNIINHVTTNNIIELKYVDLNISGNLDAKKIRDISQQIGFSSNTRGIKGEKLKIVKDKRNNLAHGDYNYSEIGRNYSIQEMIEIKEEVIKYLKVVLSNIRRFVNNKKYYNR